MEKIDSKYVDSFGGNRVSFGVPFDVIWGRETGHGVGAFANTLVSPGFGAPATSLAIKSSKNSSELLKNEKQRKLD